MKCPLCMNELTLKKEETYKIFFICSCANCDIVSIILTTTTKEFKKDGLDT